MPKPRRSWRNVYLAPTPMKDSCQGLLATVRSVSDLVEAFASVQFINGSINMKSRNDLLRPVDIYAAREKPGEPPAAMILFKTASESFPVPGLHVGGRVAAPGTMYTFDYVNSSPSEAPFCAVKRFSCARRYSAGLDDLQDSAVMSAAFVIGEQIDGSCIMFRDAVMSRYKYFARSRLAIRPANEAARAPGIMPPLPPDAPSPVEVTRRASPRSVEPFVKPVFSKVDELLPAFACDERLVFCHEISTPTLVQSYHLDSLALLEKAVM